MNRLQRIARHLLSPTWRMRRHFPPPVLQDIQRAISTAEREHAGELRFVAEHALEPLDLWSGLTARERALQVFSLLRIWDTEANNGILVYLLFAERAVEIIADRGIARCVPQAEWDALCREVETEFRDGRFRAGALRAIEGTAALLRRHFPPAGKTSNELPDQPVLL
jgi:TPM domain